MKKEIEQIRIEQKIGNRVCNGCGGKITTQEIAENSCFTDHKEIKRWEAVCKKCQKLCWGVSKEDFELAKRLVTETGYTPFEYMKEEMFKKKDDKEYMEYYLASQISGAYGIIEWFKKNLSIGEKDK